jgi:hypothetical protein
MKQLVLSNHAKERIVKGDDKGPRTKLTIDQIHQALTENKHLLFEHEVVFFSEEENKVFRFPTVEIEAGKRLAKTFLPAKARMAWPNFLARFRFQGRSILSVPNPPKKLKRENALVVGIVSFDEKAEDIMPITPICNWFVDNRNFDNLLLDMMFYHELIDYIENWWSLGVCNQHVDDLQILAMFSTRGKRFYGMRFPLWILYEVTGLEPPFKFEQKWL